MKKFTKLLSIFTLIITLISALSVTVGCNDDPVEDEWDGRTYTVFVYLPDEATPVANIRLALCYNSNGNASCLTPVKTDANGKAVIVIPENVNVDGEPVLHIYKDSDIPEGYAHPSNMTAITMADGSSYDHALALNSKETKLVLSTKN